MPQKGDTTALYVRSIYTGRAVYVLRDAGHIVFRRGRFDLDLSSRIDFGRLAA